MLLRSDHKAQIRTTRVASFPPPIRENPYQTLLYNSLHEHSFELVESRRFYAGWHFEPRNAASLTAALETARPR